MLLGSTLVLARKFDPENCLALIERHRADSLAVVPVMMQRILELPEETIRRYDTSSLKVVAASGSALPGDLAIKWMDAFGDNLYNLYGSTEVAWATIATPEDMRAAPGTAGKSPRGTVVKLFDEKGVEVPPGETGRIFVGNEMLFEGYTGGGSKDVDRRPDGHRRRGPDGRCRPPLRGGARRRDDRLRRREPVPAGGRGHARAPPGCGGGGRDRRRGRASSASACARSWCPPARAAPSEDELKKYVKKNLAGFKVPREIWFLDELPRNATGKVLKRELRVMERAPK